MSSYGACGPATCIGAVVVGNRVFLRTPSRGTGSRSVTTNRASSRHRWMQILRAERFSAREPGPSFILEATPPDSNSRYGPRWPTWHARCAAGLWDDTAAVNRLDLFIVALAVLVGWTGYRRGARLQMLSYGGLVGGLVLGTLLALDVAALASDPVTQVVLALGSILVGGAVGNAVGRILGTRFGSRAKGSRLGQVDSTAGVVVALIALALAVWFISYNLVNGPFPGVAKEIRESGVVRALDSTLPDPPSLFAQVREFFNRFGFPQVFAGLPPAPAGPVAEPSQQDAAEAFRAASWSTVRVVGRACDQIQQGSGFVVAPNYIATNAHVVAGVEAPQVQQQNGTSQEGTPVFFDPQLDVAVLRIDQTPGPVLPVAGTDAQRGDGGAVVGFPGGGSLAGTEAAVRRVIEAEGRDIYGRKRTTREVYELQASVAPGNSGSPFVLPDGEVAGLVFAASSTDKGLGYAITSTELEPGLQRAVSRTQAVSTGPCVK